MENINSLNQEINNMYREYNFRKEEKEMLFNLKKLYNKYNIEFKDIEQ